MNPTALKQQVPDQWKPHPDDEAAVIEAMRAAERGDLLSPEASEAFVRWLEGSDDDAWRAEFE